MKLRKWLLFSAVLSLMLAVHTAVALELSASPVTPFDENPVTVRSDTAGTLTLIPSLIVFLIFQKQVYAGLASGSVKG